MSRSELTPVSNLLVTLNSSVNFIIYCIFGEKFKRLFCHLFCGRKWCCFAALANKDDFPMLQRFTTTATTNATAVNNTCNSTAANAVGTTGVLVAGKYTDFSEDEDAATLKNPLSGIQDGTFQKVSATGVQLAPGYSWTTPLHVRDVPHCTGRGRVCGRQSVYKIEDAASWDLTLRSLVRPK